MRLTKGPWGFGAGIVLGFVIGSTSLAMAAFGYKGWQRFGRDFQVGYLTGFFDMANLARNLEPGGFVDEKYPAWPKATLADWHNAVNEAYKDPENQQYGMYAILQVAAGKLKEKYGPAPSALERLTPQIAQRIDKAKKAEREARAKKAASAPPAAAGTPPKTPVDPATIGPSWRHHKKRRWCPCPEETKESTDANKAAENSAPAPSVSEPAKAATAPAPAKPAAGPASKR